MAIPPITGKIAKKGRKIKVETTKKKEKLSFDLKKYIAKCRHTGVKEKLDQVYASDSASIDPAILDAQAISIPMEEW